MRYHALVTDYDGTLAHHGRVDEATVAALERLRESGRRTLLVTGRQLGDLLQLFPRATLFDRIVAENGALVYDPATREEILLTEAPPEIFLHELQRRGVSPLSSGRVIVATWHPNENVVLETIRDLGLELQVIFNKGAVMVLPTGVNKATGLVKALHTMELSPHNAVGIGDAENDHALLRVSECGVAVANALPSLKQHADWVTPGDHGAGVIDLIDALLASDLAEIEPKLARHHLAIGARKDNAPVLVSPYETNLMIAGTSGSGKSTFATSFLERLCEHDYQFCIIDPEGDYENFPGAIVVEESAQSPRSDEVLEVLAKVEDNAIVSMLDVHLSERPRVFQKLFFRLMSLRASSGRPHWIVIDEAHHLLPRGLDVSGLLSRSDASGLILITVHPEHVAPELLRLIDVLITTGQSPEDTIDRFGKIVGQQPPQFETAELQSGESIIWRRRIEEAPFWIRSIPPRAERRRHLRKYAKGELGPDKSFYFRGPEGKLKLRAHSLISFIQLAEGVDEETWLHHLHRGHYSKWFRDDIKDEDLASAAAEVERARDISAERSLERIKEEICKRYTAPA